MTKPTRSASSGRQKPPKPDVSTAQRAAAERSAAASARAEIGDQLPRRRRAAAGTGTSASGYVRLRVHVEGDRLEIVDVHHVDSELAMPDALVGEHAYDVMLGDQLLHADGVADVGVSRSFPNPDLDAPIEQRGHHFHELDSYEFDVRFPVASLTPRNLSQVRLRYFAVGAPNDVSPRSLDERRTDKGSNVIGEIVGFPRSVLER